MYESPRPPRFLRIGFRLAVVGLLLSLLGYCALEVTGSVVLIDRSGDVERANATTHNQDGQPLRRLPGGIFVGIPRLNGEGWVEIHCRDGVQRRAGYLGGIGMVRIDVTEGCTVEVIY